MFQCHKLHMHLFITGHHVIPEKRTWCNSKGKGWTTKESWNDSWQGQEIFHLTSSGAHTASYSKGIGTHSPEAKWLTTHII